jgi:hypothetical protein
MSSNKNGLLCGTTTTVSGADDSNIYVRRDAQSGSTIIDGDLTVAGNLAVALDSTLPVIRAIDISQNPIYIKNDKNLVQPNNSATIEMPRNALIVEAGADRIDISGAGVGIATYKPISQNLITSGNAENIGDLACYGINTLGELVKYGAMRVSCVDPTANAMKGRIDFIVKNNNQSRDILQIDASQNAIKSLGGARFVDTAGDIDRAIYASALKVCEAGAITKNTNATVVPEADFTIPVGLDGYYSYTAQISLDGVGDVSGANDYITTFLDLSGGSITPLVGTNNIITVVENPSNSVRIVVSGIIMERVVAGQTLRFYHSESSDAGFTFTGGAITVTYMYLGDSTL